MLQTCQIISSKWNAYAVIYQHYKTFFIHYKLSATDCSNFFQNYFHHNCYITWAHFIASTSKSAVFCGYLTQPNKQSKSACGSFVDNVVWRQDHKPLYRQLMGLLGCFILVGPRAQLFALGAGNFRQAVEALCISAGLTQNGSLLQRMGTDNAPVYVGGGKKSTHESQPKSAT